MRVVDWCCVVVSWFGRPLFPSRRSAHPEDFTPVVTSRCGVLRHGVRCGSAWGYWRTRLTTQFAECFAHVEALVHGGGGGFAYYCTGEMKRSSCVCLSARAHRLLIARNSTLQSFCCNKDRDLELPQYSVHVAITCLLGKNFLNLSQQFISVMRHNLDVTVLRAAE